MYVHAYTASKVCSPVCLPNEVSEVYHYNDSYDYSRTGMSHTHNLSRGGSLKQEGASKCVGETLHTQTSKSRTMNTLNVHFMSGSLSFGEMKCSVSWGRLERLPGHQTKAHLGTSEQSCFPLLCLHVHGAVFSCCRERFLVGSGLPKGLVLFL